MGKLGVSKIQNRIATGRRGATPSGVHHQPDRGFDRIAVEGALLLSSQLLTRILTSGTPSFFARRIAQSVTIFQTSTVRFSPAPDPQPVLKYIPHQRIDVTARNTGICIALRWHSLLSRYRYEHQWPLFNAAANARSCQRWQ